jgi:hypothetical protein
MGIIESDMAVFSETNETDINRGRTKQVPIPSTFFIEVRSISSQVMDLAWVHEVHEVGFQPSAKAGGMGYRHPHVFIHVKDFYGSPIRAENLRERPDHVLLRAACSNDHTSMATL